MTISTHPTSDLLSQPTPVSLLAYCLQRAGFPTALTLQNDSAAPPNAVFAIHLAQPLPADTLLHILSILNQRRSHQSLLILSAHPPAPRYREHLSLNDAQQVLAIRRAFRKQNIRRAKPAIRLIGIAWKLSNSSPGIAIPRSSPAPTQPLWRTAKQILRQHHRTLRHLLPAAALLDDSDTPYFLGPQTPHRPLYHAAKRFFDIAFSLFALAITFPICLIAALLIKFHDGGPIFFAHTRESLHGRPFGCLKFRTMINNADALQKDLRAQNQVDGPQFKIARDPRITPIGHFLRKTNIDELPQFLNVLAGDMSVVGPRPSPFEENQLCPAWREARLAVKPGITGLWQISRTRQRGPTDFQEWIFYDTQYAERQSFALDMRILLLTIKELFGQGQ